MRLGHTIKMLNACFRICHQQMQCCTPHKVQCIFLLSQFLIRCDTFLFMRNDFPIPIVSFTNPALKSVFDVIMRAELNFIIFFNLGLVINLVIVYISKTVF